MGGCIAMYDFYQWGYEFGHDLDPKAAIQVPGLSYQPPVFGHKRLLNFDAYSFPDWGGWLVVVSIGIAFGIYFFEYYKAIKSKIMKASSSISILLLLLFSSCTTRPEPIVIGVDQCVHCKMSIVDKKYAAEIITSKGKIIKFDDIICMKNYIQINDDLAKKEANYLVSDYNNPNQLIPIESADFYKSEKFQTPMGGHIISVLKKSALPTLISEEQIKKIAWNDIVE